MGEGEIIFKHKGVMKEKSHPEDEGQPSVLPSGPTKGGQASAKLQNRFIL